jgi:hypothetical protein
MATREELRELRKSFDGSDPFMGNPQIIVVRKRPKNVPYWAMNDKLTREVINRSFPKWRISKNQRKRAARWIQVIVLYFRKDMPHNQVAEEMHIGYGTLRTLIRNIRRAGANNRANGTGGRTRKVPHTVQLM